MDHQFTLLFYFHCENCPMQNPVSNTFISFRCHCAELYQVNFAQRFDAVSTLSLLQQMICNSCLIHCKIPIIQRRHPSVGPCTIHWLDSHSLHSNRLLKLKVKNNWFAVYLAIPTEISPILFHISDSMKNITLAYINLITSFVPMQHFSHKRKPFGEQ